MGMDFFPSGLQSTAGPRQPPFPAVPPRFAFLPQPLPGNSFSSWAPAEGKIAECGSSAEAGRGSGAECGSSAEGKIAECGSSAEAGARKWRGSCPPRKDPEARSQIGAEVRFWLWCRFRLCSLPLPPLQRCKSVKFPRGKQLGQKASQFSAAKGGQGLGWQVLGRQCGTGANAEVVRKWGVRNRGQCGSGAEVGFPPFRGMRK